MLDFIKRIYSRDESSSRSQANNRLRVVLSHDRLNLTPEVLNLLKEDIIAVIANHLDVDGKPEVRLITEGRNTALDISIPLKGRY
ncbi:MAG: cell division topological specificity factor MinE [Syntrophomonadaceae bacterium]|jgi:cell division topological specificity factor|nr:cell division topological specificity factor MinE [Bacillota bacterium]HAA08510.1 cell division topological specificity factor [Syntrophomonas sp.]HQA50469.1 cell division topological specificity factor MinE [Syntrophomonadaceae bacterium]HQD89751.1 cell division topological specificity factor MinE [Syntrophomonadaceae bacterium]